MRFKYLIFLILISYFGKSQNNLFNSTADWSISSYNVNMTCITNDIYNSYFNGDTIINSNQYYKLYKSGNKYSQSGCPSIFNYYYTDLNLHILTRYFNKKIYFIDLNASNPTEKIFLDYNLNIGDTIKNVGFTTTPFNNFSFVVSSIDSFLLNTSYFKIFNFFDQYQGQHFLVEKFGSSFGFIEPFVHFEMESHLNCYVSSGITRFVSPKNTDANCSLITGLNNLDENNLISVSPNPTNGLLNISYPHQQKEPINVYVKDILGKEMSMTQIFQNQNTININNLNSGIYFIEFKTLNGIVIKKIIKE
ncbi:MAG: Soluble aldose sugar dehydrogenase YliI precursor [Bacteroidetes bacterium]|nr:Soluble aldose sugar dehydrogenase YliI precursor [Bacteroidota bacterium]MDF2451831.1 Soluble aldose sugar dehydrogenase YliI precursor [Bacteroidota bacterium]